MGTVVKFRNIPKKDRHFQTYKADVRFSDNRVDSFVNSAKVSNAQYKNMSKYDQRGTTIWNAKDYLCKCLSVGITLNGITDIMSDVYKIAYCKGVFAYRKHKDRIDVSCGWV